jgi:hypothetical protein
MPILGDHQDVIQKAIVVQREHVAERVKLLRCPHQTSKIQVGKLWVLSLDSLYETFAQSNCCFLDGSRRQLEDVTHALRARKLSENGLEVRCTKRTEDVLFRWRTISEEQLE